jgi:dTDP-4-amino-4,6-dideoxygalactose transaminase
LVLPGINANMNKMQALMGIQVLKYLDEIILKRAKMPRYIETGSKKFPAFGASTRETNSVKCCFAETGTI